MPPSLPDVASLSAIDVHVHAEVSKAGHHSLSGELEQASASYFKTGGQRKPTLPEIAAYEELKRVARRVDDDAASRLQSPTRTQHLLVDHAADPSFTGGTGSV